MELFHILFICFLLFLVNDADVMLSNQRSLSWFDAQKICRSNNATLLESVSIDVNLTGNVWNGKYRRLSSWIKLVGCFTEDSAILASSTIVYGMQMSSAGFCQEICLSFYMTMFAVKFKECRCLKKIPHEKNKVFPSKCNAVCNKKGTRTEKPYFEECGGNRTYSVFQSGTEDEKAAGSNAVGSSCVAIKCSESSTSKFYFEGNCSLHYQPQCHTDTTVVGSWMESMQFCKLNHSSAYLFKDIFLNNIKKTCNTDRQEIKDMHWLGVAKEAYDGNDLGLNIRDKEKDPFNGCMLCSYRNGKFIRCDYEICKENQTSFLLCTKMTESTALSTTIPAIMPSTATQDISSLEEPNTQTVPTIYFSATMTTSTTTNEKIIEKHPNEKEEDFQVIYPIVIAVGIGGGFFIALVFTYFCYCKKKYKTKTQDKVAGQEHSEGTRTSGLINYAYFTIELQDQTIKSSSLDNKIVGPYTVANEEMYDHLRDKQSRKNTDDVGNKYDTTKNVIAMKKEYSQSTEGTYDRLGDERCGTNTVDTYHHAFTVIKERSDYDVTEERKQYIHDSAYYHVEIVSNENDTDQNSFSNLSDKQNEDHTYFILED